MISKATIEKVHDAADIVEISRDYVQNLKKKGSVYSACCPFHNENNPSFIVSPGRGTYHCFSCKEHGDAISFVMKKEGMTYTQAIEKIAERYGIQVQYDNKEISDEDRKKKDRSEALIAVMKVVQEYFTSSIDEKSPEAEKARNYAFGRWGEKYCREIGIGYAPASYDGALNYCKSRGIDVQDLIECGIVKESDKDKRKYDFFRERVTIPIKDRTGNIIAYTARYIGSRPDVGKYYNSPTTPIYSKGNTVFGLQTAARHARIAGRFIIVEGAPDTIALQSDSVRLFETVAALGTAWTENQLRQLKKIADVLCFIPDGDVPKEGSPFGAGVEAVMRSGAKAMELGFDVSVREIPQAEDGKKQDPDSFITSREIFQSLEDVHFPVWYGSKVLMTAESDADKAAAMQKIAKEVLMMVSNEAILDIDIEKLSKIFGRTKRWRDAIKKAKLESKKEAQRKKEADLSEEQQAMRECGVSVKNGCYGAYEDGEGFVRWSNFTMKPMYHIIDGDNAIRIFKLKNASGQIVEIEFRQEELVSLPRFMQRVESMGNYLFRGGKDDFTKIREYLYSITKSAVKVQNMGWNNKDNLYAFGDGVFYDGDFFSVDEYGIVKVDDKSYYLPAFSKMYESSPEAFQFERSFSTKNHGSFSMSQFMSKIVQVFGDNAKIGLAFVIAALFKDIIGRHVEGFPLLNVFGEKGTGKTLLGKSLMSFFIKGMKTVKLGSVSKPAINDLLSASENSVFHLDEYKNGMDVALVEYLKGIWDGVGQTKKNMDGDKKAKTSYVRCAVILTGQDMPNRDDALLSRLIHLSYSKTEHTSEQMEWFDELKEMVDKGAQHLTIELLNLRKNFESDFKSHFDICRSSLRRALEEDNNIEDRIFNNWLITLTAVHLVCTEIRLPFSFEEYFKLTIEGLRKQCSLIKKNSDVAEFWKLVDAGHMQGRVVEKAHFIIRSQDEYRKSNGEAISFECQKPVLYMNYQNVCASIGSRLGGINMIGRLDQSSLEAYLRTHPAYMGSKQQRFRMLLNNGQPDYDMVPNGAGGHIKRYKEIRPMAMVFDYDILKSMYEINLESITSYEYDEDAELNQS